MNNDTIIYINVPNAKSFHRLLAYESSIINSIYEKSDTQKILQQFYTFDIQSMRNLLESLDFQHVYELKGGFSSYISNK